MKLLSIELFGEYKGLKDQAFDFSMAKGDVAVLIGANGSGKSQVMELIAEAFAYLERQQRKDFRVRAALGYDFCLIYEMASSRYQGVRRFVLDTRNGIHIAVHELADTIHVDNAKPGRRTWRQITAAGVIEELVLPRVIGYPLNLQDTAVQTVCCRQKRCRQDGLYCVAGSSNLLDREKAIHAYADRFKSTVCT